MTIANNLFFYYKKKKSSLYFPKTFSFIHRKRLHDSVLLLLPLCVVGSGKVFLAASLKGQSVSQTLGVKYDILFIISLINVIFLMSITVFLVDKFDFFKTFAMFFLMYCINTRLTFIFFPYLHMALLMIWFINLMLFSSQFLLDAKQRK